MLLDKNTLITYLMNELSDQILIDCEPILNDGCWTGKIRISERRPDQPGRTIHESYSENTIKELRDSIDSYYFNIAEQIRLCREEELNHD